jgi:lysophospholipase L1-like esterase
MTPARSATAVVGRLPPARRRLGILPCAWACVLSIAGPARAEPATSPDTPAATASAPARGARLARWQDSFDAFDAADRQHAPVPGGVLFVGSSSIRLWDSLEEDFQALPVVTKRGFGGSRLSDCSDAVARLVLPYRPSTVIVYAGDNDLAEGATPNEVLGSFRTFVDAVHRDLPRTRIAYLSIKPSPLRAALLANIRETNRLIAGYVAHGRRLDFIDVYSRMVGRDGQPRPELFRADRLHLNRAGYALWRTEIAAHLGPVLVGTSVEGAATSAAPAPRPAVAASPAGR